MSESVAGDSVEVARRRAEAAVRDAARSAVEQREVWLAEQASEVRFYLGRALKSVLLAGQVLAGVKQSLPHGEWLQWVEREFSFSARTATRYAGVYLMVSKFVEVGPDMPDFDVPLTSLYRIAGGHTSEELQLEVVTAMVQRTRLAASLVDGIVEKYERVAEREAVLMNAPEEVADVVRGYDMDSRAAMALGAIYSGDQELFEEIATSGAIHGSGDEAIPLADAGWRDVARYAKTREFERGQALKESATGSAVRIVLDGVRPDSREKFYERAHWSVRHERHQYFRGLTDAAWRDLTGAEVRIFEGPVEIRFTAYLKNKPIDADNLDCKPFIDALIGWCLVDDSPEHVPTVVSTSRIDAANPRVVIELIPIPGGRVYD